MLRAVSLALWVSFSLVACTSSEPDPAPSPGSLAQAFDQGTLSFQSTPRPGYGGRKLRLAGEYTYVLEIRRGDDGQESRRLVAYGPGIQVRWLREAQPGERFNDFTIHPSGELSLSVERTMAERNTYDVLRLAADGTLRARAPLPGPTTVPQSDLGTSLPQPPFLMKSIAAGPYVDHYLPWVRVEARGEDLVVAFTSLVNVPEGTMPPGRLTAGAMALRWSGTRYDEEWTRVVDGANVLFEVAWQYDEFQWRDAMAQPLLAVSPEGRVVVGRTWSRTRCTASADLFREFPRTTCSFSSDHRYQPFAFTSFSAAGSREGTHAYVPALMDDFVVFDMAVRDDEVALAGTVVRVGEDGTVAYYPSRPGASDAMRPYDGYVVVLDRTTGAVRAEHSLDEGRGDYLAAIRGTEEGWLAVGGADWDRWNGGMSISRGADPLLVFIPRQGGPVRKKRLALEPADRHFHLLSVDVQGGAVRATGLAEAPMTHSGDDGNPLHMTFGSLRVELR